MRPASLNTTSSTYTSASYHPDSRFWLFQTIEAGIFVEMALVLLAFSIWWIRKRIS